MKLGESHIQNQAGQASWALKDSTFRLCFLRGHAFKPQDSPKM
jgi:hypothetical protein